MDIIIFFMKKTHWFFYIIGLTLVLGSCQQKEKEQETSVMYEIKGDKPCYIFGTLHSEPKEFEKLLEIPLQKLKESDEIFFEANYQTDEVKQILGPVMVEWEIYDTYPDSLKQILEPYRKVLYLPKGQNLENTLDKEAYERLLQYYQSHKKHIEQYSERSIWSSINHINKMREEEKKVDFDKTLFQEGIKANKKLRGFETFHEIFDVWRPLSIEQQIFLMNNILNNKEKLDSNKVRQERAYLEGDINMISLIDRDLFANAGEKQWKKDLDNRLYDLRNEKYLAILKGEIGKAKLFITVGAARMGGDKGLIKQLELAGYKLEPVKL